MQDMLDMQKIKYTSYSVGEYKGADLPLTCTEYSPANREAVQKLLHSMTSQVVAGIAAARHMTPEMVSICRCRTCRSQPCPALVCCASFLLCMMCHWVAGAYFKCSSVSEMSLTAVLLLSAQPLSSKARECAERLPGDQGHMCIQLGSALDFFSYIVLYILIIYILNYN